MSKVEGELWSPEGGKTLSTLYNLLAVLDTSKVPQLFELWQKDIPELADNDWEEGIQQYLPLLIFARDRFIQLKFLHRAYYSPACLARKYPDRTANCPKCSLENADFFYLVWSCPEVVNFWKNILTDINSIGKLTIPYSPIPVILVTFSRPLGGKNYLFFMPRSTLEKW